ncbi:MAG: hypothetical protein RBR53_09410 [Desulforegulaceae bacterium]|nr:hypothetical protein [Desulforegulaceae bacterium]
MTQVDKTKNKLFLIFLPSLFTAHILWTIFIFLSNKELLEKSKALKIENNILISPAGLAAKGLEMFSTGFFSAVFFTFTAGVFFTFTGVFLGFLYSKSKNKLKTFLIIFYIFLLILIGYLLGDYFANILIGILSFFLTIKLKPNIYFTKIYILPIIALAIIPFLYNGNSFFSDFRDKVLLTNSFGKAINNFYYKFTLYPAEIIKSPLKKQLKTAQLIGFNHSEQKHLESVLEKYNYFHLKNKNVKKDIKIFKFKNKVNLKTKNLELDFDCKSFLSDTDKIIIKIAEKQQSPFLIKITIVGFVIFLPILLIFSFSIFLKTLFKLIFSNKTSEISTSVSFILILYLVLFPVFNSSFNEKLTIEKEINSTNKFKRINALKYIYQNKIKFPVSDKNLNSSYDAERYWAVLNFPIKTPKDLDKIIKKTRDDNINVRCKAYQRIGTISPFYEKHYKMASEFLNSDYYKIKDWYVQWYAYNYGKKILLK